jgi:hypothetical protein
MPYQDHTNIESWTRSFLAAGFTHEESEYLREKPCLIDLHNHYAKQIIYIDDLQLKEHYRLMCITVRNAIIEFPFLTPGAWDSYYRSLQSEYGESTHESA